MFPQTPIVPTPPDVIYKVQAGRAGKIEFFNRASAEAYLAFRGYKTATIEHWCNGQILGFAAYVDGKAVALKGTFDRNLIDDTKA